MKLRPLLVADQCEIPILVGRKDWWWMYGKLFKAPCSQRSFT